MPCPDSKRGGVDVIRTGTIAGDKQLIVRASDCFCAHADEITTAAAETAHRVMAEVYCSSDGVVEWRGAYAVTAGTCSLLAHEGRGFALYFSGQFDAELPDGTEELRDYVYQAIEDWEAECFDALEAEES